jgi:3'-phosphoadenosine 5'-phosphosulfate (PAPS) 3'-phosphatase
MASRWSGVYQPVDDILYAAALGAGAYVVESGECQALRVSTENELARLRPVVSRSHRPPILGDLLRGLGVQQESVVGSLGLKIGLLARGQSEAPVRRHGQQRGRPGLAGRVPGGFAR